MKTLPEIIKVNRYEDNRIYFEYESRIYTSLYLTYLDNDIEKTDLYGYDLVDNTFVLKKELDCDFAPSPTSAKVICLYILEALASGKMMMCRKQYYSEHSAEFWEPCFQPEDADDIEMVIGHIRNRLS